MAKEQKIALLEIGTARRERAIHLLSSVVMELSVRELTVEAHNLSEMDSAALSDLISSSAKIVILIQEPLSSPVTLSAGFNNLQLLAMRRCTEGRKRMVHVIKNFNSSEYDMKFGFHPRAQEMLRFWDLELKSLIDVSNHIRSTITDDSGFSSPGESFAWQLAVGFLSYILPNMRGQIRSSLLGDDGLIRQDVLSSFGLTDVDTKRTLVVPRFHLILDERIVCSQQSASSTYPHNLFPGCRKMQGNPLSNASTELCLEFDSPGYKKRIPAYLMELEKPLTNRQSTYTHAVIFCGYAAPMFIVVYLLC